VNKWWTDSRSIYALSLNLWFLWATKSDASSLSIVAAYKKGHCHTLSIESDSDLSTTTSASDHSNDLATATTKSKVVGCLASGTSS